MSWLSEGLRKVGVSKAVQRAITKPLAVATLGPIGAIIPVAKANPATAGAPPVEVAVQQAATTPPDQAGALIQGFQAILNQIKPQAPAAPAAPPVSTEPKKNWMPWALAGTGALVLALGAVMAFRK